MKRQVDVRWRWLFTTVMMLLSCGARSAGAAEPSLDLLGRLPSGALAAAEMSGLQVALEHVRNSDLLQFTRNSEPYQNFAKSPQYRQVQTGRNFAEAFLGMSLWDAGQKLLGHRLALALYPNPDGGQPHAVGILQVQEVETLAEFRKRIMPFLTELAPDEQSPIEGMPIAIYSVNNQAFVAFHQDWVAGSNDKQLLGRSLQRLLAKRPPADGLTAMPAYQAMLRDQGRDHFLQAFVDLSRVRDAYQVAVPRKLDNPLGSLLFGGIAELAATSAYLGVSVDHDDHGFRLRGGVAGGPSTVPASHQPFFSDPKSSGTDPVPELDGLIGGIALHRNFAEWYRAREHLIEERLLPEFDKFETALANFLPGRDFGEDILPLLGSQITLVAAPQSYDHLDGRPGVQLPGFGLIIELQEPATGGDVLALFFQTLTAILNIEAGQQGRQPWIVTSESYNGAQIAFARYLKRPTGDRLPIVFNFTPSSTRIGKRFVICTSRDLCRNIVDQLRKPATKVKQQNRNFAFEVRGAAVALALGANRELFTAESIKSGKTIEQANREMQLIEELIRRVERLRLTTQVHAHSFQIELEGQWR